MDDFGISRKPSAIRHIAVVYQFFGNCGMMRVREEREMSKFTDHIAKGEELLEEVDKQPYVQGTMATLAVGHFMAAALILLADDTVRAQFGRGVPKVWPS